ncbi:hypothetical protein [Staphylococcus pettenkoferi]|uniref:hypothetical protein n=1 Tax=Staphylococcus pettenkoferi TaxID=170573 RepID=UPI002556ED3D|nr:hypothetical protein [Staphylococcus pettenkoferi]MDK7284316.1 hypothetical protein [Staphylococcus pettenkoferi]
MTNGKIKHYNKDKGYELLPRELLQACDKQSPHSKGLSLQAIGLLVNLQSYPETWVLSKSELYKRYAKNGKTSVSNAWNELVENDYIVQFHKREGRKNQYVYYFSLTPFTKEDIKEIERMENNESSKTLNLKEKYSHQKDTEENNNPDSETQSLSFRLSASQNENLKVSFSKPESNILHREENTQEENTQHKSRVNDMNDMNVNKNINKSKPLHSNHSVHQHQLPDDNFLKDYEVQTFPELTASYLKNFDIKEIRIVKNVILKAKAHFNNNHDNHLMLEDLDATLIEVLKRFKAIVIKKNESVYDMQGYLMQSLLTEFDEIYSVQMARQNFEKDKIFDWLHQE